LHNLIAKLAKQIQEKNRFTAVGIAVCDAGNLTGLAVAGTRRHNSNIAVKAADKWHIGSITKSLTSTMVGTLVDEKLLAFNATIPELLPEIPAHPSWAACSLEHLLTHTSGLPPNFPLRARSIDPATSADLSSMRRDLISAALAKPPRKPSGSVFAYSNLGYAVAGYIAETKTGTAYEELVDQKIFKPYGLESAGFGPPQGETPDDQPMGHYATLWYRKPCSPFEGRADNSPVISAAARAHMNLEDLVTYGNEHLKGELGTGRYLNTNTWRRLHKAVTNDYGYGWMNCEREWADGSVIWHNGSNTMWYAQLMLLPNKNAVLAFVTNNGAIRKAEKAFTAAAKQIAALMN